MTAFADTVSPHRGRVDGLSLRTRPGLSGETKRETGHAASTGLARSAARSAVKWPARAWGGLDLLIGAGSFAVAHLLSPWARSGGTAYGMGRASVVFGISLLFFSYIFGVYDRHNFMSRGRMLAQALSVNGLALALVSVIFGWFGYIHIGRLIVLWTFVFSVSGTLACRLSARELARRAKIRVLFVGPRKKFRPLAVRLRGLYSAFYERPAYFVCAGSAVPARRAELLDAVRRERPDEVVVMDNDPVLMDVLHHSGTILRAGCAIFSYTKYYEKLLSEVPVDSVDERGVLGHGFDVGSLHTGLAKRPMDVALALFGLVVGAPLMLFCALLVRLTSPGPIIYSQVRVGRYGREFRIYKFRTMRTDAEKNGAVWARSGDSRITPVGGLLRKTRFDELPQLWNILRGHMSFVGPRPERPEFVEQLRQQIPHYDLRHFVPPGLTGWAQVRFRYGATVEDAQRKLAYDLFYVRNCGLVFDAAVCLRTLVAMAKGAR
jgi:exopolysaccharide biosynthesis polyprenyl glycosylphosphotransferase